MKSSYVLSFLVLLLIACDTSNNVEPRFEKYFIMYYGSEGQQEGVDIVVNEDGSMLLLGNSFLLTGTEYPFVIKVNSNGIVMWEKNVGGENEIAVDIEPIKSGTNAGKFIVVTNKTEGNVTNVHLHIIDQNGNVLGDGIELPMHANGAVQFARSITSLDNGDGYVLTGYADGALIRESSPEITPANDLQDILALSLDDALAITDTIVTKGGEMTGSGVKIFAMPEESTSPYALFGFSDRPYNSNVFKLKYTYDFVFSGIPVGRMIGADSEENTLAAAIETPDAPGGGFLMAGTSRTSEFSGDIFLVKLNQALDITTFQKKFSFGKNMECANVAVGTDGFYVLGNEVSDTGKRNINLIKTGFDGTEEWVLPFGTPEGDDKGGAVSILPDGRVVVVGTMELQTDKKLALIVMNANGQF